MITEIGSGFELINFLIVQINVIIIEVWPLTIMGSNQTGSMEKKEYLFKVLVVGECETGKTSVITQYVHRKFENNYKATVRQ